MEEKMVLDPCSHQGDLLPEMGVGTEDDQFGGGLTEAFLALLY